MVLSIFTVVVEVIRNGFGIFQEENGGKQSLRAKMRLYSKLTSFNLCKELCVIGSRNNPAYIRTSIVTNYKEQLSVKRKDHRFALSALFLDELTFSGLIKVVGMQNKCYYNRLTKACP